MKHSVVSKGEAHISDLARKRVIVSVIKLVTLRCHSGVSHDNIAVIMQVQMYFVSGERTLENRQFAIVIKSIACCIGSALLAFF